MSFYFRCDLCAPGDFCNPFRGSCIGRALSAGLGILFGGLLVIVTVTLLIFVPVCLDRLKNIVIRCRYANFLELWGSREGLMSLRNPSSIPYGPQLGPGWAPVGNAPWVKYSPPPPPEQVVFGFDSWLVLGSLRVEAWQSYLGF